MDFKWAMDLGLVRKPSAFVSTICDDRKEELIYAGVEIGKVFDDNLGRSIIYADTYERGGEKGSSSMPSRYRSELNFAFDLAQTRPALDCRP